MAAFRLALEHGADGIEFDVHVSADGVPVVLHDANVRRTTAGAGAVQRMKLSQIRELDAGAWYDAAFSGERIPTLDEVLALAADAGAAVFPEIKGHRTVADLRLVCDSLARHALLDRTVLLAFDWRDLAAARELQPEITLGFELDRAGRLPYALRAMERFGNAVLSCSTALILQDDRVLRTVREVGFPVAAWTVNDPLVGISLAAAGVETLITDDVETIRAALDPPSPLRNPEDRAL